MSCPRAAPLSLGQRLIPSWPYLIALVLFGRLLAARASLLNDPDTYLHIAAGRWILAHQALPLRDPFSHSMPGATWLPSEWLAEIALALIYSAVGWSGIVVTTAACEALSVGLLLHFLLRHLQAVPALITAIAAAALLQPHALARPHVFALPLLTLWCGLLLAARDAGRAPPFFALPLMLLWANLHASCLFGVALAGYLAVEAIWSPGDGRSRQREVLQWGLFVGASLIAAVLTPHGIDSVLQPVRLMQMPALQATFSEWMSPDFQKSPALEFWLLGLLFVGLLSGMRLPFSRLILLLGLVHLSLQHSRHADLLAIVGPLAVALPLGRQLAEVTASQPPSALFLRAADLARPASPAGVVLALTVATALAAAALLQPIVRSNDAVTPAAALAAARQLGLSGPVFNSQAFGGYLIFERIPTFIDGRIELYGNEFLARDYQAERGSSPALPEVLDRYRIAWALLTPSAGAVSVLDHLDGWERVYGDAWAVVFRRAADRP